MGTDRSLSRLKAAELKELAANLEMQLTGKEKRDQLLAAIMEHSRDKLKSLKVSELRSFADDSGIDMGGARKKNDIVEAILSAMDEAALKALFVRDQEAAQDIDLEVIGDELVETAKELETVVRDLEEHQAPDMADIYDIDQRISDVVKQDIDVTGVASLLDMGRVKFLDRKYVESMTMLMEASTVCRQFYNNYNEVTHAFVILSAEKILEECRQAESNDEAAADALIHAKRSFLAGGKTRDLAIQALAEIANTVYREEIVFLEERMAFIEPLINAMRVQGVDVFNAERYLHRSREAFLVGELANVNDYLEKALSTAEESKETWIDEIYNDIPRVESIISQASDLGADTTGAVKHLDQAKVAFENEDYSLCAELKKLAERKAMESQHSQIQKAAQLEREKLGDADKILAAVYPLVREAEAYGLNVQHINISMTNARNALINNDYVNALTYAREAEAQSKPVWTQVKARRESILSGGQPLKHCQTCNIMGITILPGGRAVCANCGMVYDVQVRGQQGSRKKKKKGWNPLK